MLVLYLTLNNPNLKLNNVKGVVLSQTRQFLNVSFLVVPRLFEEKWRDTVFGFPWGVVRGAWCVVRGAWRVVRGAWCVVRGAWRVVRGAWCVVRGSEFLVGTLSP